MENIYSKEGYVQTFLDRELGLLHVNWENLYDTEIVKESCNAQLKAVQEGHAKVLIIDVKNTKGVPSVECQEWFGNFLFPSFNDAGMKALVNVIPESAITKMAAKRWAKTSAPFGFDMFEAESVEAAKEALQDYL